MRSLRLKEIAPGVDDTVAATDFHRSIADETLPEGPFRRRGTAEGFLATGNDRPAATRRLVLLGGSFVESMFAPETERFPSRIERGLPADWRVLNGGYSGMTTLHALTQLPAKIVPFASGRHRLVYFVPMSDSNALIAAGHYWSASKNVSPFVPAAEVPSVERSSREASAGLLRALVSAARALGVDLVVVASPFRRGDFSTDAALQALYRGERGRYARALQRFALLREVAAEVCAEQSVPFLDSQEFMEDPALFYDQMHLNLRGQQVYAEELGRRLPDLLPALAEGEPAAS